MIQSRDYVEALRPLAGARQRRFRRTRRIEVVDHARYGGPEKTGFGSYGSLIIFVGRDAGRVREAKSALKAGEAGMQRLVAGIDAQMSALKPGTVDSVIEQVASAPVFGAITYGGATVADPVFLPPGLDLTAFMVPYSGGRLTRQGFSFVEYVEEPKAEPLSLFVLRTDPELSRAEAAALAGVPSAMTNLHVGVAYECEYTTLMAIAFGVAGGIVGAAAGGVKGAIVGAAAGAVVGAAIDAALVHAVASRLSLQRSQLGADELRRLGPELSAKQLVNARLEAMQQARLALARR